MPYLVVVLVIKKKIFIDPVKNEETTVFISSLQLYDYFL